MSDFLFSPTPDEEATEFIKSKPVVSREVFGELLPELKPLAFCISGVEAANTVQSIRDRIADLPSGANWEDIKADLVKELHPFLRSEDDPENTRAAERRAELLLRTHGFQAYQQGAYAAMDRQKDVMPYWQYISMEDDHVRPGHAALNGIVLPAEHEFWKTHFPPWDFGCRCQAIAISQEDYDEIAVKDKQRNPDNRQILDEPAQRELTVSRRLVRNGVAYNLTSPAEARKPGAFSWHPGDMKLSVDALKARYDDSTWATFEAWARKAVVPERKLTVWEWLNHQTILPATAPVRLPEANPPSFAEMKPKLEAVVVKHGGRVEKLKRTMEEALQKSLLSGGPISKKAEKAAVVLHHAIARRQDAVMKVLALPESERAQIVLKYKGHPGSEMVLEHRRGADFLQSLTSSKVLSGPAVDVRLVADRAHADPYGTYINGRRMRAGVVAHELCHIIEARNPAALKASVEFLDARTSGEYATWMGPGYKYSEVAKDDHWVQRGGVKYTGKIYTHQGRRYATEILSTGIERLYADAAQFFEKDPDFVRHVVDTLRGVV